MLALSGQLTQATTAAIDAQIASSTAFIQAAFDNYATGIEMGVDVVRSALAAATVAATQLLAAKDSKELFSVGVSQSEHALERSRAYGRQATEALQNSRAQFSQVASKEGEVARQKLIELAETMTKRRWSPGPG